MYVQYVSFYLFIANKKVAQNLTNVPSVDIIEVR